MPHTMPAHKCFTVIEMVTVISLILVIASLLLPTFQHATKQARGVVCANNLRNLTIAWISYTGDNSGKLVNATAAISDPAYAPPGAPPWSFIVSYTGGATKQQQEAAMEKGSLWPYVQNRKSYHCPDHPFNGTPKELVRNYSINNFTGGLEAPGGCPDPMGKSANGPINRPGAGRIATLSMIFNPAKTFVFIEEDDNRGDLTGSFVLGLNKDTWFFTDPPGRWHSINTLDKGGTMFSFADGHTEYWGWRDCRTRTINSDPMVTMTQPQPGNLDLVRLKLAVCPGNPYFPVLNGFPNK